METRAGYMIVGLFVLSSIAGILGFFLWLAKSDLDYNVNYYTIYFPGAVTGLTIGGSVNYLGVPVGTVKNITLDERNLDRVNITVAIKGSISIKEDAYASLELQGLTGYKLVQIYGGSPDSPPLKVKVGEKYPVIPSRYSGVEEIMTTLPRMVNKFTNLIDRINATFNEKNRAHFAKALKNIEDLTQQLAKSSKPLHRILETLDKDLDKITQSARGALTNVEGVSREISLFLSDNKIALDTFTQTGSYELLQTLTETRDAATSLSRLLDKIEENPQGLIFETQRKGVFIPPK